MKLRTTYILIFCQVFLHGCDSNVDENPAQPPPDRKAVEKETKDSPDQGKTAELPKTTASTAGEKLLDVEAVGKLLADREASAKESQANAYGYAWMDFISLNSPVVGNPAKLWETWRPTSTVYLPDGGKPAPWGTTATVPTEVLEKANSLPNWPTSSVWHNLDTRIQVDGQVLRDKWNQDVRYQLLMNKDTFNYLVSRGFYNVNGQEEAARKNERADFPLTAYELKTSYIWIGTDEAKYDALKAKYYIVRAYYQSQNDDGTPGPWVVGYAAFSGMHIIDKATPKWVWITFENVNNSDFTQVKLELPIASGARVANQRYQTALKKAGSVFAEYQLNGVQTQFTQSDGTPILLANSQIESAFQKKSSCSTCHAIASINKAGQYFNLVDSRGGNVTYYVGNPPNVEATGFVGLDFVWSMRRAHRASSSKTK